MTQAIAFAASDTLAAQDARARLARRYGDCPPAQADVIVALGGDGFMLATLHAHQGSGRPVYGMNRGTVGFLMNEYAEDDLPARLAAAEQAILNPLAMTAETADGTRTRALAINEVSLLRTGAQAAKLRVSVDGRTRLDELVCDGALLSTPRRIDRLQLFRPRPDPAHRGRGAGPDRHRAVPAPPLARCAAAQGRGGAVRRAGPPANAR